MQRIEQLLFWLGHFGLITAGSTLFLRDYITTDYLGNAFFVSGLLSYTVGLGLSIYLDKKDSTRRANNTETQTLGSVLKIPLLICLCVVLFMSGAVIVIASFMEKSIG